jgi:2-polyprenyl-3-methyl-5-hydroxy-6-metoxy-1,4-benzoquinol methylase
MAVNKDDWEKTNRAYLRQISKLSSSGVQWNRGRILEIRDLLGGWNHNIKLPYGVFTAHCDDYYPARREILKIISHQLNGNFIGKQILDIGCLEGYFSAECALQGADVLGIDGKIINKSAVNLDVNKV